MKKILIISSTPWDDNNSFGNTFSNLFKDIDCKIANIYLKPGLPNNKLENIIYFQINPKDLVKNIYNKKHKTGHIINEKQINNDNNINVNFIKQNRWTIFFILYELLWNIGNWKSKELWKFIEDFKPDLMYVPIYKSCFHSKIYLYIKNKFQIPIIGHVSDDVYLFNDENFISKIYQFFIRKSIYRFIKNCKFVDCFSYIQKEEYEKIFNVPFKIRYKSTNIENNEIKKEYNNPLIFLYTGNLGNQRWKNLVEIGNVLDKINKEEERAILNIYSGTIITKEMEQTFNNCKSLNFIGSVSGEEVQRLQSQADVLIHAESFDKRESQAVRMSLSTKIIDYLGKGKCILAYGPKEITSIDYFIKNDCGLVIYSKDDLFNKINSIINNNDLLYNYSIKALETAKNNHNPKKLHKIFYEDMVSII